MRKIVIAIDGPAASGKSTTARLAAQRLGYLHVDTGAMYRALTLRVLEDKISLDDVEAIRALADRSTITFIRADGKYRVIVDGRDVTEAIRSADVTRSVSKVSSYQAIRDVLVREQRRLAAEGGVVLEGRDIGTVVVPNAHLKIFMVADVAERARRRKRELEMVGASVERERLEEEIRERDLLDSTRDASPLRKAPDAIELDTSSLTIDQQVQFVVERAMELIMKGDS